MFSSLNDLCYRATSQYTLVGFDGCAMFIP